MPANFERVLTVSRRAGADYSQPGVGEMRFGVINPNPVTGQTNPSQPGRWYGPATDTFTVEAGNVIVNTANGGRCPYVISGKALPGQPLECTFAGRTLVVLGGTVAAGARVQSDANGAAITQASSGIALGTALEAGVEGDIISIEFASPA